MGRPARLLVEIVGDSRGLGRTVDSADSKLGKLGSAARTAGKAAAVGIGAGVAALGALAVSSVKSASELEQSTGAVETVFGKASGAVKRFAADAADNVGLAKTQYQELAAVIGTQMQRFGQSQAEAAVSTDKLIGLGADLAATYGGTVSEAVSAVSSLLRGERDPIERYGVGINAAAVASELAAKGLGGLTGEAKSQAEAQATLSLLFDQTSKAQGAFGRESDTLAGQQERLRAKFENVKAEIGEKLLPVITRFASWIVDTGIPAVQRLWGWLQENLGPAFRKVGAWVRDDLVPALSDLWTWFRDKIAPIIRDTVMPIVDSLKEAFKDVTGSVDDNKGTLKKLAAFADDVLLPVLKGLGKFFEFTLSAQIRAAGKAVSFVIDLVDTLVGSIEWAMEKLGKLKNAATGGGVFGQGWSIFSGVAGMYGMTPGGLGGGPSLTGLSPMATAGLASLTTATHSPGGSVGSLTGRAGGQVYVDQRQVSVRVEGALDPVAVGTQIEGILKAHGIRTGRAVTYGPAT